MADEYLPLDQARGVSAPDGYLPLSAITPAKPPETRSFLGASAAAGGHALLAAGARLVDQLNPFTLSEEDLAYVYRNNPERFKEVQEKGAELALSRFANEQTQRAREIMQQIRPTEKGDISGKPLTELEYKTLDPEKAAYLSPTRVAGDVLQSLPSTLALGVAAVLTRGASTKAFANAEAQAIASGASAIEAQAIARSAAIAAGAEKMAVTGAAGEGAIGYAQAINQATNEAKDIKPEVYENSPAYQELLTQGYTPETARQALIAKAANEAGLIAGAVDAATNLVGGRVLGKVIGGGGPVLARTGKGIVSESAVETLQSGGEQFGQNLAFQKNLNPNQDLSQGVGEAMVAGGVVGGVMGGATSAMFGRAQSKQREALGEKALNNAHSAGEAAMAANAMAGTVDELTQAVDQYLQQPAAQTATLQLPAGPDITALRARADQSAVQNDQALNNLVGEAFGVPPSSLNYPGLEGTRTPGAGPDIAALRARADQGDQTVDRLIAEATGAGSLRSNATPPLATLEAMAAANQGPVAPLAVNAPPSMPEQRAAVDRNAELLAQANAEPLTFDRDNALAQTQVGQDASRTLAGDQYLDLTPMTPLQAKQRLAVVREQTGNPLGLAITPHPTQPGRLAIARVALPDLNIATTPAPIAPEVTQQRIEQAALAGDVNARKAEDQPRQVVVTRALRNVEERGGVASPAEAQIFYEANLGQPYDRVDPNLAPALSVDEQLTQATGIALQNRPRVQVAQAQPNTEVAADQEARVASDRAQREQILQTQIEATRVQATPVGDVISAMATPAVDRTNSQRVAIEQAQTRMDPVDFSIVQRAAVAPFMLDKAERTRLAELRAPAPAPAPVVEAAPVDELMGERTRTALGLPAPGNIVLTNAKFSTARAPAPGVTETINDNGTEHLVSFVDAGRLGDTGRLITQVARIFGKRVAVFTSPTLKADGFVRDDDNQNIYINLNSQISPLTVFGHETLHLLKRDNSAAYQALSAVVQRTMAATGATGFRNDYQGAGPNPNTALNAGELEELSADLMGNRFQDPAFWQDVFTEIGVQHPDNARSVITRLGAAMRKAINAFRAVVQQDGFRADEFVKDLDQVKAAVRSAVVEYAKTQRTTAIAMEQEMARAERGVTLTTTVPAGGQTGQRATAQNVTPSKQRDAVPGETEISTQNAQGPQRKYNPITEMLSIDEAAVREAMEANPKIEPRIIDAILSYGFIPRDTPRDQAIAVFKKNIVSNLLYLYNKVPAEIRQRSKMWYDGANRIATEMAKEYGVRMEQVAGIMAAMSPQKDWFQNVSMAERALDILSKQGDSVWTDSMLRYARSYVFEAKEADEREKRQDAYDRAVQIKAANTTLKDLSDGDAAVFIRAYDEAFHSRNYRIVTPEGGFGSLMLANDNSTPRTMMWSGYGPIKKSVSIYRDGTRENISEQLGFEHKIRSFYNNISAPNSDISHVTIDTHAVAAALFDALAGTDTPVTQNFGGTGKSISVGVGGTYGLIADAYREAAAQVGLKAREMQSVTWEAVRGLFGADEKTELKGPVRAIWERYRNGETSFEAARDEVVLAAGGITDPFWIDNDRGQRVAEGGTSYDKGFVPAGGVRLRAENELVNRASVNLTVATQSIPGLKELYARAMAGEQDAGALIQRVAESSLRYLLGGTNAKITVTDASGVYDKNREPSIAAMVVFKDSDAPSVLAGLAAFADMYSQEQVHVRTKTSRSVGFDFNDGSYATAVYNVPLEKALSEKDIKTIIKEIGIEGFSVSETEDGPELTTYFVQPTEGATNASAIREAFESFVSRVTRAHGAYGRAGSRSGRSIERLYVYGNGAGARIGFADIRGDLRTGEASDTRTPRLIAEYLNKSPVKAFQSRSLTQGQMRSQRTLAAVFDALPTDDLKNPLVQRAYDALTKELVRQFKVLPIKVDVMANVRIGKDEFAYVGKNVGELQQKLESLGVPAANANLAIKYLQRSYGAPSKSWKTGPLATIESVDGEPYASSAAMREDVSNRNQFKVFRTSPATFGPKGSDFSSHPLLKNSGLKDINGYPMLYNDLLRAVHDYYAHNLSRPEFGPQGEYWAWANHMSSTTDPLARWALTAETRAQNAWQNFKPGAQDVPLRERGFAIQKAALPPAQFALTGDAKVDAPMLKLIEELSPAERRGSLPEGSKIKLPAEITKSATRPPENLRAKADELKNMSEEERDEVDIYDFGYRAYVLYEAEKMMPKKDGAFKTVSSSNSMSLYQEADAVVNVNNKPFLATKEEDPDDEERTIWNFVSAEESFYDKVITTDYEEKEDAVAQLKQILGGQITKSATRTPEFKRWFGNSEIVDENGEPLVVYHGTHFPGIKEFKTGRAAAIYFTPRKDHALNGYGPNIIEAYLSVQKLGDLTDTNSGAYKLAVRAFNANGGWSENEDAMESRTSPNFDPKIDETWEMFDNPTTDIGADLLRAGYDGLKLNEYGGDISYAVFDPKQIKAVTGNNGEFSPANPDITQSRERTGVNVNQDGENRYADKIVDGEKTLETRNSDSLRPYVGERVSIVRTGDGPAKAIGAVTIGEPIVVKTQREFDKYRDRTLVPKGSKFDLAPGGVKYMYPLENPERYEAEKNVGLGIVSREVMLSRQRQENTPEFKRWFGDSKVMDEDGKPLVVYHGTSGDFSEFKTEGWGLDEQGAFFTSSPQVASDYADTHGTAANVMPVYLSIKNPYVVTSQQWARGDGLSPADAKRRGYDGYIVREHPGVIESDAAGDTFIVFKPEQIKSAIGNNGEFSPTNPDITQSRQRIVGDSSRAYTPEQLAMFEHTGRTVTEPTLKERVASLRQDLGKKLAQGMVDPFYALKELDPKSYLLARMSKGATGAFEAMLKHGKINLKDGVYDADMSGGFLDRVGIPLQGELEDFLWWVAGNRAERLSTEDRERLFTAKDITAAKSLDQGTADYDYTLQHGPGAGTVTRDRTKIYRDALRSFDEFNKNALDMAEQSGLIDKDSRQYWEHEFYVPFYRVAEEDGSVAGPGIKDGLVRQQAFKKLKGGTDKLNSDLLANTLQNWAHLLDASAKNRAGLSAAEAAVKMGVAVEADDKTVRSMGKSIGKKNNVVWVMDQGRERYFLVDDPYVMASLSAIEFTGYKGAVIDAMAMFKNVLTVGVTASPYYKVRNLIRDSLQTVATAPLSYNVLKNVKEGFAASSKSSQTYVSALAGGGLIRFGSMLEGNNAERTRVLIDRGVDKSTILDSDAKVKAFYNNYIKAGWDAYNELGNRSEEITRASLYSQLTKKGMSHAEASFMARDLQDFSLQGTWGAVRFLTQVVPFMNARMQGLYKLGRAANEDPKRFAAVLGATALASIALLAAYEDDDDWKKREDWDRNNYWWFKIAGVAFRIPKPFEIGAIATLAERGLEYFISKEMTGKRLGRNVYEIIRDQLSMNPTPQFAKPVLDIYANKDSFTNRPIETMGMERLQPQYRYTASTSMVARGLSSATLGALSPVQYDHLLRGYFGWLGSFVVGAADMALRPLTGQPERPAADMWKFASGGMIASLPADQSRYVSQMYEQAKELEQAYGTYRMLVKQNPAEAREFYQENKEALAKYRGVERVKSTEAKYNEMIRMIERSPIDPELKRERIQRIRVQKDKVARYVAPGIR